MMWTFNTEATEDDLLEAHEWHMNTPYFLRASCEFNSREDFLHELRQGTLFKGMIDGQYKAVVFGQTKNNNVVEGHLFCERRLNKDFLTALIMFAKTESLKKYKQVLIEIPAKSKGLQKLIDRAGFNHTGLSKWSDVIHGKLFETQFYLAES